jgi:hypothetical protein
VLVAPPLSGRDGFVFVLMILPQVHLRNASSRSH